MVTDDEIEYKLEKLNPKPHQRRPIVKKSLSSSEEVTGNCHHTNPTVSTGNQMRGKTRSGPILQFNGELDEGQDEWENH